MLAAAVDLARGDRHQAIGLRVRQRPENRRVDDAEDREVDADAEREHGDDGGNARLAQSAYGVAAVLPQLVEQALPAGGAEFFFQAFCAAELEPRAALRLGRRHAAPHQVVGVGVDMEPQLVGDAVLEALPPERDGERGPQRAKKSHVTSPCR